MIETNDFHVPTPTELGVRIRRVLAGLNKYKVNQVRGKEKGDILNQKSRIKEEKKAEKMKSRENDLTKRHKHGNEFVDKTFKESFFFSVFQRWMGNMIGPSLKFWQS